ncbi:TIGR03905 family TSCPD domain-containing protein [uncultured Duncaniella sp.]|uniref:TIGR03905 family TSCPD domain-containing protein n=1 Tax=uncultured Duncaniella sp. TaxID=2768039 RepID=UPI0026043226|nr:TIGR03905 family TSCPD domain-containing protein [uncultured Duncaniella sp.]
MRYQYATSGTCSRLIDIEVDDNGCITDVAFTGGCHGNLQGIAALVKGRRMADVIETLEGIRCGNKPTSCPDQLACALRAISESK